MEGGENECDGMCASHFHLPHPTQTKTRCIGTVFEKNWNSFEMEKSICKIKKYDDMRQTSDTILYCIDFITSQRRLPCPLIHLRTKTPIATSSLTIYQSHDDHP